MTQLYIAIALWCSLPGAGEASIERCRVELQHCMGLPDWPGEQRIAKCMQSLNAGKGKEGQ